MLRIAVVGSGPSGVYTAQSLLDQRAAWPVPLAVDVLDRLPCPYGLVRYGVAPDHEKIKSLQNNLRQVLERPDVRFLGNVPVGEGGISARELRGLYHAVIYCVGAARDRRLGIPGEDLAGSCSATDFVSWYSAHPDAIGQGFPLGGRGAVVIGAGNVAVDVARVLARGVEELRATDIPQGPLDALAASAVTDVHMVARRGPSQAKCTTKELRELGTLPGADVVVRAEELAADPGYADPAGLSATARRNVAALRGWAEAPAGTAARRIHLRFFLRPVEILDDGRGAVRGVRFERTAPDASGGVTGTGELMDIDAGLVLRSVGYRGVPLPGLPFDPVGGTVPHAGGGCCGTVRRRSASMSRAGSSADRRGSSAPTGRAPRRRPARCWPTCPSWRGVRWQRKTRCRGWRRPGSRPSRGEAGWASRPPRRRWAGRCRAAR